jgi:hypothetical protein
MWGKRVDVLTRNCLNAVGMIWRHDEREAADAVSLRSAPRIFTSLLLVFALSTNLCSSRTAQPGFHRQSVPLPQPAGSNGLYARARSPPWFREVLVKSALSLYGLSGKILYPSILSVPDGFMWSETISAEQIGRHRRKRAK